MNTGNIEDVYPLSPLQEGMLFHTLYAPEEGAYFDHLVCEMRALGGLDRAAFQGAVQDVIDRHQALRTAFTWKLRDRTRQVVLRRLRVPLAEEDWRGRSEDEHRAGLAAFLEQDRRNGYDLSRPPLMRIALLRLEEDVYYFVFSYHHIVMDAWSMTTVISDLLGSYRARAADRPVETTPPRRFRSYIDWLTGRDLTRAEAFWRQELDGFHTPTPLGGDDAAQGIVEASRQRPVEVELAPSAAAALAAVGRQHGLTPLTLVIGAWSLVLSCYANERDVVFGTVVSGRPPELEGVESIVGLFTNTLPVRVRPHGGEPARAWLQELQAGLFASREHQWAPMSRMQEWSEVPRGVPLFDSVIVAWNVPEKVFPMVEGRQLELRMVHHDPRNNFPLSLMVDQGPPFMLRLIFDAARFDRHDVHRRLVHLRSVLEAMGRGLERPVGELAALPGAERHRVLVESNDSGAAFPLGRCVHELIDEQARRTPEAVAATCGTRSLRYEELRRESDAVAHQLLCEPRPERIVAVLADRGLPLLAAMLGIFKSGAAYLPLDPGHPDPRLQQVLSLSGCSTLLATRPFLDAARRAAGAVPGVRVLCIEDVVPGGGEPPAVAVEPRQLAYVIYTSGSTGVPKGAMVEHAGMLNHLYAKVGDLGLSARDVVAETASQCFDISIWQFLSALLVGGRVHVVSDEVAHEPPALAAEVEREGVTILEVVPSMLRMLLDDAQGGGAGAGDGLLGLSCMMATGEALPPDLCRRWLARFPGVPLVNAYGPTECSDDVTHHFVERPPPAGAPRVPVGRSVANMRNYVLDDRLDPLPTGTAGELFVAGVGVGRGYLNDPRRTAAAFLPDPFAAAPGGRLYRTGDRMRRLPDGTLDFLGRVDFQVKVRGYRIELGEIEAVLEQHPRVHAAVVLVRDGEANDGPRVVAYVVPEPVSPAPAGPAGREPSGSDGERAAQWEAVFDEVYGRGQVSGRDEALHLPVWTDSYTGRPFSEEEAFESVEDSVGRLRTLEPRRVLEIGCGTGLILLRLAPHCDEYWGTDISAVAVERLRRRLEEHPIATPVHLSQRAAEDLEGLPGGFDVVVLNEVVQYFASVEYLVTVIERAARLVRPGGTLFLGGIRSFPLFEAFQTSVALFQSAASATAGDLRRRVRGQLAQEKELLVAPDLFRALASHLPGLRGVTVLLKGGRAVNEFTRFRYDALLSIGGPAAEAAKVPHAGWREDGWTLERLAERLAGGAAGGLYLARVPNARIAHDVRAVQLLAGADPSETVARLRDRIAAAATQGGVDPEAIRALARQWGHECQILWAEGDGAGDFDVFIGRAGDAAEAVRAWPVDAGRAPRPWSGYANAPGREQAGTELVRELREHLGRRLPDYMLPNAFAVLDELPLTPNGKVDRRALLATDEAPAAELAARQQAGTLTEELVAAIWSDVLPRTAIGRDTDFFEAGGHSLLATQVMSRVRRTFGLEIPLRALFDARTVRRFAERIDAARWGDGERRQPLERADRDGPRPVSFAQQRLWLTEQIEGAGAAYNLPSAIRVDGRLNVHALEAAIGEIVRRHHVLRTRFVTVDDQPMQLVEPPRRWLLDVVDLRGVPEARKDAEVARLARQEARRAFDLGRAPLLRALLLRVEDGAHVVLFTMHHVVSDAWSVGVLVRELVELYGAFCAGIPSALPELPTQYADFAEWQRGWLQGERLDAQLGYWTRQLGARPAPLRLPLDRPRPAARSFEGGTLSFRLSPELSASIHALGRSQGTTLFMTVLAGFKALLARETGQTDVVVGTDIANRNVAEIEELIGFFINLLVLRTDLSGSPTFRQLLARVSEVTIGAYTHQDLAFDLLVREMRAHWGAPDASLFDVLFVLQNAPVEALELPGAELRPLPVEGETTRFDLALFVEDAPAGIVGRWSYRTDLFDAGTIARLSARFEALLASAVAHPDAGIDELDVTSAAERSESARRRESSFNRLKRRAPEGVS
ncbi:MAG: Linear gramicidin synthetase subunit [Gemmatimonadetes bacterium]|nr:Linear gramicidin synthetase subunit [Gemmatimonadota bacterium]